MRDKAGLLIAGGLVLAGLGGLLLLGGNSDRRLDRSLIGFSGLAVWLGESGVAARQAHPRLSPHLRDLSLRVLPLYDMDLAQAAEPPETKRDWYRQTVQRDMAQESFDVKLKDLKTLVVLPKWRTGFPETGTASAAALIGLEDYPRLFQQLGLHSLQLRRRGPDFLQEQAAGHAIALFHAQLFSRESLPGSCRPLVTLDSGVLLMACGEKKKGRGMLVLSDPDLLNNHGLAVADNAGFAAQWFKDQAGADGGDVYIDTSSNVLTAYEEDQSERRDYERSGDDLSRFFAFPFSVLWAMLLVVTGILFWRGAVRFGPLETQGAGAGHAHTKSAAIAAQARLLRLSGNDGQMVADFVQEQLQELTVRTFGPDLGQHGQARYFAHLARRDAALAGSFEQTARALISRGAAMPPAELHQHLNTYKSLLEKVESSHGSH
ncbi:hypothetical protein [Leisingera thetidis]|uniref:hypothetical protein n=1 Tax=Leisingera thetidis TaxID=2930199 RepID=UPI0021F7E813|nr:hypothetical protein [Leisingera thetidis]